MCKTECAIEDRAYPPGQHGQGRKKISDYGLQLREKQKARRFYLVYEKQFHKYYEEATHRRGVTGEGMLQQLEMRLDNIVYRSGLVASRPEARSSSPTAISKSMVRSSTSHRFRHNPAW